MIISRLKSVTQFALFVLSVIIVLMSCSKESPCTQSDNLALKIELSKSNTDSLLVPRIENCTDSEVLLIRNDEVRDKEAAASSEASEKFYSNIIEMEQEEKTVKSTDLDLQEVFYDPGGFRLVQISPKETKKVGAIYLGDFIKRSGFDRTNKFRMRLIIDADTLFVKEYLTNDQYKTYNRLKDSVKVIRQELISDWITVYPENL